MHNDRRAVTCWCAPKYGHDRVNSRTLLFIVVVTGTHAASFTPAYCSMCQPWAGMSTSVSCCPDSSRWPFNLLIWWEIILLTIMASRCKSGRGFRWCRWLKTSRGSTWYDVKVFVVDRCWCPSNPNCTCCRCQLFCIHSLQWIQS